MTEPSARPSRTATPCSSVVAVIRSPRAVMMSACAPWIGAPPPVTVTVSPGLVGGGWTVMRAVAVLLSPASVTVSFAVYVPGVS